MSRHDHGDPDLPEEHAGGGPRRGDQSEQKFGMKMIGLVGVSSMISYCLVTSARRSDFKIGKVRLTNDEPMTIEELSFLSFKATDRTALGGQLDDVIEVLLMLGDQSLSAMASQAFLICRQPGLEQSR